MGFFDALMGEFVDVIEWIDDSNDTMVYRFDRHDNEIKYGAKLIVRESQMAVFINEGKVADVVSPGTYELETKNLPILSTLQNWHHGFNSPFRAEVYFFSTRQFTNLKWGTKNPIIVRDAEFDVVRIRAYGTYTIRVSDPVTFIKEVAGTDGYFTVEEISDQLRDFIVLEFTEWLGRTDLPLLDMAANIKQLSDAIQQSIASDFTRYGIMLEKLLVENISLPDNVEAALDKRSSRSITGDLSAHIQYGMGESLHNPNGSSIGSAAVELGLGMAMAKQVMHDDELNTAANQPPPLPLTGWHVAINNQTTGPHTEPALQAMLDAKQLTEDTYVWQTGMEEWQRAGELVFFKRLFD